MTAADVLEAARTLADTLTDLPDDTGELVALWRDLKDAADVLYVQVKRLGEKIVAADPDSRGWHNGGRPVEVRRRFEVEVLNHERFVDWLASVDVEERRGAEVEWKPSVNGAARDLIRRAVTVDGEQPAGVSAGFSAPFLAKGRT